MAEKLERDILADLYRDQALRMVYLAMAMGCSQHEGEDAVHQVFERLIKIEERLEKMTPKERVGYLIASVRNAARDTGRRKATVPLPLEAYEDFVGNPMGEERLIAEIAALPSELGEVLYTRFCLGFAVNEAAEFLGCSRRTLMRRQEKARALLNRELWGKGGEL